MVNSYYELDLHHGGFAPKRFENLVTAKAQLKFLKENGFPNAFLTKVTVERIVLKDAFVVRTLEQVEIFKSKSFKAA